MAMYVWLKHTAEDRGGEDKEKLETKSITSKAMQYQQDVWQSAESTASGVNCYLSNNHT